MGRSMASPPAWEMLSGFPSCTCATNPEQLPDELPPGIPQACSHLYMKKSADKGLFQIALSPALSLGSREGSPVGRESEKPQGVRVLRGGPVSIVIYPMPPRDTDDEPRTPQSVPAFASLADERAANDMGVLLMGGVSRADSPASPKWRTVRSSGQKSPFRRPCSGSGRSSSANGRSRKSCNPGSVILTMPSRSFEVDIKLEKVADAGSANSSDELAGKTHMTDSAEANGEKCPKFRFYKHTISSLISSRIVNMNKEARMLQESDCKRKGAYKPPRASLSAPSKGPPGSMRCMYDSYSKQSKRQPRQFSFL